MGKAKEWKNKARAEKASEELTLPSGMVITARRPGPMQLMQWDKLPTALAAAVTGTKITAGDLSTRDLSELAEFMRTLIMWCCVDPRVSLNPQSEEEIHPREIPEQDWVFIVNWALRVPEERALQPFRDGRTDDGGDRDGEGVRAEAVEPAGDQRSRTLLEL